MEPTPTGSRQTYSEALAAEIRACLGRANITQAALASAIGIGSGTMSRKLAGRYAFDTDELTRIAAHLGVSPSSLLRDAEAALGVPA